MTGRNISQNDLNHFQNTNSIKSKLVYGLQEGGKKAHFNILFKQNAGGKISNTKSCPVTNINNNEVNRDKTGTSTSPHSRQLPTSALRGNIFNINPISNSKAQVINAFSGAKKNFEDLNGNVKHHGCSQTPKFLYSSAASSTNEIHHQPNKKHSANEQVIFQQSCFCGLNSVKRQFSYQPPNQQNQSNVRLSVPPNGSPVSAAANISFRPNFNPFSTSPKEYFTNTPRYMKKINKNMSQLRNCQTAYPKYSQTSNFRHFSPAAGCIIEANGENNANEQFTIRKQSSNCPTSTEEQPSSQTPNQQNSEYRTINVGDCDIAKALMLAYDLE